MPSFFGSSGPSDTRRSGRKVATLVAPRETRPDKEQPDTNATATESTAPAQGPGRRSALVRPAPAKHNGSGPHRSAIPDPLPPPGTGREVGRFVFWTGIGVDPGAEVREWLRRHGGFHLAAFDLWGVAATLAGRSDRFAGPAAKSMRLEPYEPDVSRRPWVLAVGQRCARESRTHNHYAHLQGVDLGGSARLEEVDGGPLLVEELLPTLWLDGEGLPVWYSQSNGSGGAPSLCWQAQRATRLSAEVLQGRVPAQLDWAAGWSLTREVLEGAVVVGEAG